METKRVIIVVIVLGLIVIVPWATVCLLPAIRYDVINNGIRKVLFHSDSDQYCYQFLFKVPDSDYWGALSDTTSKKNKYLFLSKDSTVLNNNFKHPSISIFQLYKGDSGSFHYITITKDTLYIRGDIKDRVINNGNVVCLHTTKRIQEHLEPDVSGTLQFYPNEPNVILSVSNADNSLDYRSYQHIGNPSYLRIHGKGQKTTYGEIRHRR